MGLNLRDFTERFDAKEGYAFLPYTGCYNEGEFRGYDVFAYIGETGTGVRKALGNLFSEVRFQGDKGNVGNLATNEPGDPKVIVMTGSTSGHTNALMGNSLAYGKAHGEDPKKLNLSEEALERLHGVIKEVCSLLSSSPITREDLLSETGAVVPLRLKQNKLGAATAFKNGPALNADQKAFAEKRELYVRMIEDSATDELAATLWSKDVLGENERLTTFIHEDPAHGGLYAEIRILPTASAEEMDA